MIIAIAVTLLVNESVRGDWLAGFGRPGTDNQINATVVHDDGRGQRLFIGGSFTDFSVVGGLGSVRIRSIASWDGTRYEQVGEGFEDFVHDLVVLPTPEGNRLIAAGTDLSSGSVTIEGVAQWDGQSWQPLGSFYDAFATDLEVWDTGRSVFLVATGSFQLTEKDPVVHAVLWDGFSWTAMGAEMRGSTRLAMFDLGDGLVPIAGGPFNNGKGGASIQLRFFEGSEWTQIGDLEFPGAILAMVAWDDGRGPALYIGGGFASLPGIPDARRLVRWDGRRWSAVGGGVTGEEVQSHVRALFPAELHDEPVLYVAGRFQAAGDIAAKSIARWNGKTFASLGAGINPIGFEFPEVRALAEFDSGGGPEIIASGFFREAGTVLARGIARFNGAGWRTVGVYHWIFDKIEKLRVLDWGEGPQLVAVGDFNSVSDSSLTTVCGAVAAWNGLRWTSIGHGIDGLARNAVVFDDGEGPALYVAGQVQLNSGGDGLLRWRDHQWQAVVGANQINGQLNVLEVFDDGTGPALYVGGDFTSIAGQPIRRLARYDGRTWSEVGGGIDFAGPGFAEVLALRSVDLDAEGPEPPRLIVGGAFNRAGELATTGVAAWDGKSFQGFGTSIIKFTFGIRAIGWFDAPDGRELMIGGGFVFDSLSDPAKINLARWDGAAWKPAGAPDHVVHDFEMASGPEGASLYAVGQFDFIGGVSCGGVARWDGTAWQSMHGGVTSTSPTGGARGVARYAGLGSPAVYVGGSFHSAGTVASINFAAWTEEPQIPMIQASSSTRQITAKVSGSVPFALQWRMDGEALADGLGIAGSSSATLIVDDPGDSVFDLVVESPQGIAISDAMVFSEDLLGDINHDAAVDGADLGLLLGAWGDCDFGAPCDADLNADGVVDGADLGILLGAWTG